MGTLPSGTATFLFTDIEGSTRHWEQHRAAMKEALDRHNTILSGAIKAHGGEVFRMEGDAFRASFTTAPAALAAAYDAQQALQKENWGGVGVLRVRMALDSGVSDVTEERGGDYVGPLLNRVARLLAVCYGGQTLLTQATERLVREELPPGASLRYLGKHDLRDLKEPEHIFQLVGADIQTDFLPLKTLKAHPNNLPLQLTPLIGRKREIAACRAQLEDPQVRLLTLLGTGGIGKTRLGLQVAAELLNTFADGVFFVDLAPLRDPSLVVSSIAQALGVRETGGQPLLASLKEYLRERQLLLVLDNFERLVAAAARVTELLKAAPRLKVLVTSRAALHLAAEHQFSVPPLQLPDPEHLPSLEALVQCEGVALFVERTQAVKPSFAVTAANAPVVAELCVRLEGLPLAIELAAARSKVLSPPDLLKRITKRLDLLKLEAPDLPPRHQALRATLEWSHALLSAPEQVLFRRLSVFAGGWTLEAAETIGAGEGIEPEAVLDLLTQLVDNSLVVTEEPGEGTSLPDTYWLERK